MLGCVGVYPPLARLRWGIGERGQRICGLGMSRDIPVDLNMGAPWALQQGLDSQSSVLCERLRPNRPWVLGMLAGN